MTATTKMHVDIPKDEVVFTRIIDAPRALVFNAWTDPKYMAQWWGPNAFANPVCEMDVRAGGRYRIVMRSPDGVEYPIKGVYREIVEPERLVYTQDLAEVPDDWKNLLNEKLQMAGRKLSLESLMTVNFEEYDGKTKLTIRQVRDAMLKMQMAEGWAESLERLEELLQTIS
jgi:uncharacterized protein YndB with AHSA1/START domain